MDPSEPVIFQEPPRIPSGLSEVVKYKLEAKAYKTRIRSVTWIFIEVIATLLVLGIIWINVDWVKIVVTVIAILMAIILFIALSYVL